MNFLAKGTHVYTTGWLCQNFQQSLDVVQRVLDAAKIEPVLVINGLPHFGGDAIIALREAIADAD